MDSKAKSIVVDYIRNNFGNPNAVGAQVFMVWSCYILGNRKYLFGYTKSNHYFEVTYNKIAEEWYLDVYKKMDNILIR